MSAIVEVTPFKYIGVASGLLGAIFAMSSLLGPILGGVITTSGSWRWIFYLKYVLSQSSRSVESPSTSI